MKLEDYYHNLPTDNWDTDREAEYHRQISQGQYQAWHETNQLITFNAQQNDTLSEINSLVDTI